MRPGPSIQPRLIWFVMSFNPLSAPQALREAPLSLRSRGGDMAGQPALHVGPSRMPASVLQTDCKRTAGEMLTRGGAKRYKGHAGRSPAARLAGP